MASRLSVPLICSLALSGVAVSGSAALADSDCATSFCGTRSLDTGRLGIGGALGHEFQVDQRDGDQLSLLAQFRLTYRTSVELEIGRTEYHDSNDVDKRLGGALAFQVGRLAFLSPYIVAGTGVYGTSENPYLEAGGGVKFPITRNLVLMLDVRSGHRWGEDGGSVDVQPLSGASPDGGNDIVTNPNRGELDYSRWRLVGMVFF